MIEHYISIAIAANFSIATFVATYKLRTLPCYICEGIVRSRRPVRSTKGWPECNSTIFEIKRGDGQEENQPEPAVSELTNFRIQEIHDPVRAFDGTAANQSASW